jgi:hypothetical protein
MTQSSTDAMNDPPQLMPPSETSQTQLANASWRKSRAGALYGRVSFRVGPVRDSASHGSSQEDDQHGGGDGGDHLGTATSARDSSVVSVSPPSYWTRDRPSDITRRTVPILSPRFTRAPSVTTCPRSLPIEVLPPGC